MVKIKTPFLFFGQVLNGSPKPWEFFKIDGLMVNAYEILQSDSASTKIREIGIHSYLGFSNPIAMDSGGFLFMQKKRMDIKPEIVMQLYEESKPNFGVVLDHPLMPNLPSYISRQRRLKTLKNTKRMVQMKKNSNLELVPVIHGYKTKSINWYLQKLQKIADFRIYGIGSLVPSVFSTKDVGGIHNVVKIVSHVRKMLPEEKKIHVFGIGSTLTMHLMFYAGADSVDTSSWRSKAAFGAIQLPGLGDRWITPVRRHKYYPELKRDERPILEACKCPACDRHSLDGLKRSFKLRALHNAWVYQKEIEKTRKLVKNDVYEDYVRDTIGKTQYSSVLRHVG